MALRQPRLLTPAITADASHLSIDPRHVINLRVFIVYPRIKPQDKYCRGRSRRLAATIAATNFRPAALVCALFAVQLTRSGYKYNTPDKGCGIWPRFTRQGARGVHRRFDLHDSSRGACGDADTALGSAQGRNLPVEYTVTRHGSCRVACRGAPASARASWRRRRLARRR